jgi:type VII secretion protein EccE
VDRAAAPNLRTSRVRPRAGAFTVLHIVCLELVVVVMAGVWLTARSRVVPIAVGSAVLLALVFGRAGGRWWYETVLTRAALRRRRRSARRMLHRLATAEPRAAAMATLMPGLVIRNVLDRGRSIGVGSDDQGWFAAVAVGSWADASGQRACRLDLDHVVRILHESTVPVSALQVISFQLLGPAAFGDTTRAVLRSYRELLAVEGCPVDQSVWLAMRLAPVDAVEAAQTRGGGVDGVDRALAAVVGRIEKALTAAGLPYQVLDADSLGDALGLACGLDALTTSPPRPADVQETWTTWRAGALTHATFTVTRWPRRPRPDLVAELSRLPAFGVSVSMAVHRRGDAVALLGLVRVVAPAAALRGAVNQLQATTRRLGLRLRRLDGEQARGVSATAPTGGPP